MNATALDQARPFDRYAGYLKEGHFTLWGKVVSMIALSGHFGITDVEAAARLGMTKATFGRRRRELKTMGLVEYSGKRRAGGRVWRMK